MKNTFKKLTAAVMAFTLLGAGTTITKTILPKSDNTLVADACNGSNHPSSERTYIKTWTQVSGGYLKVYDRYRCVCGSYIDSLRTQFHI